jgi:acetyltransferase-like isoleucine patch superfamily enzyme
MLGWNELVKSQLGYCGTEVFIGHNVLFANPQKVFLGDRVRIDPFTFITAGLKTGSNVQICAYAMLGGGNEHTITLGDWSFIGYGSKLFCASEDYSGEHGPVNEFWGNNEIRRGDIEFKDYAGIASDVIVFPSVIIPEGCTIGAKSFLHTNTLLHEWAVMIGNPPAHHKFRNKEKVIQLANDPTFRKIKCASI